MALYGWYKFDYDSLVLVWRRKWQPTPVFLPGESQGPESLVGFRLWGRTESDTTEQLSTILFIVEGKWLGGAREDFRGATTGYGWGIPVLQFVNFIMLYTLDLCSLVYAYYANPKRKMCCCFLKSWRFLLIRLAHIQVWQHDLLARLQRKQVLSFIIDRSAKLYNSVKRNLIIFNKILLSL